MLSIFHWDVLDEIFYLIESVSKVFSYLLLPPKCFFQENKIEKLKTVSNGLFSHAPLMF